MRGNSNFTSFGSDDTRLPPVVPDGQNNKLLFEDEQRNTSGNPALDEILKSNEEIKKLREKRKFARYVAFFSGVLGLLAGALISSGICIFTTGNFSVLTVDLIPLGIIIYMATLALTSRI